MVFLWPPRSGWESAVSESPGASLLRVTVAEADAGSSDPLPDPPRPGWEGRGPSHGPAAGLVLENIRTNQPKTLKGVGNQRDGDCHYPGRGRAESAVPKEQAAPRRPEALLARRKRRVPAGAVGACSVNAVDPQSEGQGVAVARSVRKKTQRPKEQGNLR